MNDFRSTNAAWVHVTIVLGAWALVAVATSIWAASADRFEGIGASYIVATVVAWSLIAMLVALAGRFVARKAVKVFLIGWGSVGVGMPIAIVAGGERLEEGYWAMAEAVGLSCGCGVIAGAFLAYVVVGKGSGGAGGCGAGGDGGGCGGG